MQELSALQQQYVFPHCVLSRMLQDGAHNLKCPQMEDEDTKCVKFK